MSDFPFYFQMGWEHMLSPDALDHIMFIAALAAIYVWRQWKQVLILITAFTVGHSVTLALSVTGWINAPVWLIELLIPLTIMLTAIGNIVQRAQTISPLRINYAFALFFGLIHGLAFANLLQMLLAADQNFAAAMVSFSIGLELAQVLVVAFVLLLAFIFISLLKLNRRWWIRGISAIVFALALEMFISRWP